MRADLMTLTFDLSTLGYDVLQTFFFLVVGFAMAEIS